MKKIAQQLGGRPTIDVKRDEIKKLVSDSLTQLNTAMEQAMGNLTQQITGQLNTIVQNLSTEVERKLNELKGAIFTVDPQQAQQTQQADRFLDITKESKKKKKKSPHSLYPAPEHPTPRDTEHTKELPPFWRRNFDYGEKNKTK